MNSTMKAMEGPHIGRLGGARILDLTSMLLGSLATGLLADPGADVAKAKNPRESRGGSPSGDIRRSTGINPAEGLGHVAAPKFLFDAKHPKEGTYRALRRPDGNSAALDEFYRHAPKFREQDAGFTAAFASAADKGEI